MTEPRRRRTGAIWLATLAVLVAGCAETEFLVHGAKRISGDSGSVPVTRGEYKVGTPYRIAGTWYYPAEDYGYRETGVASWYGPKFHGRRTANGETFDMNEMTAAHRTLPMPSVIRVVNLENGRSVLLRVNDRGPFARNRILDVSRRGAQLLGFQRRGTARVRVEILPDESRRLKMLALQGDPRARAPVVASAPVPRDVEARPLTGTPVAAPAPVAPAPVTVAAVAPPAVVGSAPVGPTELFVQAGAYLRFESASRVRTRLARFGPAWVTPTQVGDQKFYRVRIGPLSSVERADAVLADVVQAGFPKATLIVD